MRQTEGQEGYLSHHVEGRHVFVRIDLVEEVVHVPNLISPKFNDGELVLLRERQGPIRA